LNSPAAALIWEIWARNRKRLVTIFAILAGFVVIHPWLCAWAGLNPGGRDSLDVILSLGATPDYISPPLERLIEISALLFLVLSPLAAMTLSLLSLIWLFTFVEFGPKSKSLRAFPMRIFTLPISTGFLCFSLMSVGMASLALLYLGWTSLVRLPRIVGVFGSLMDCLGWLTLLALTQAIFWSLSGWPKTRALVLMMVLFSFLVFPGSPLPFVAGLDPYRTLILITLLSLSVVLGYFGLARMRHGRWRASAWKFRWPSLATARSEASNQPVAFGSTNRAQFWFEWHNSAAPLLYSVMGMAGVLLLITALLAMFGGLADDSAVPLGLLLIALPPFVFQLYGLTGGRALPVFSLVRPLTSGDLVVIKSKALALSAVLSWVAVLAVLCAFPLLGDLSGLTQHHVVLAQSLSQLRPMFPIILPGMIFATWGLAAGNLCFGMAGGSWPSKIPVITFCGAMVGGTALLWLGQDPAFRQIFLRAVPGALGFLVIAKLFLACWAFCVALRRKLLARAAMMKYLIVWTTFAAIFIVPTILVLRHELSHDQVSTRALFSLSCGILLMMPLARIAFAPIALSLGRHRTS
jgi:hypothetical protein